MFLNTKYLKLVIVGCDRVITMQLPIFLPAAFCSEFFLQLYSPSFRPKSLLKYIIMSKVLQHIFKDEVKEKERCSRVMVSCWYLRAEESTWVKYMSGKRIWFSVTVNLFQQCQVYDANVIVLFDKCWYSKARTLPHCTLLTCLEVVCVTRRSFQSVFNQRPFYS